MLAVYRQSIGFWVFLLSDLDTPVLSAVHAQKKHHIRFV